MCGPTRQNQAISVNNQQRISVRTSDIPYRHSDHYLYIMIYDIRSSTPGISCIKTP